MKRGFTLVEMLATLIIIALISAIVIPSVSTLIKNNRVDMCNSQIENIESAARLWANDNLVYLPTKENDVVVSINDLLESKVDLNDEYGTLVLTVGYLQDEGYIDDVYDAVLKENIDKDVAIKITKKGKTYNYEILYTCSNQNSGNYQPIFSKASSLVYDENGFCKTDGSTYNYMGGCYIKGTPDNNYVWYNGFMWRIMGINSDRTVRLITDEAVTTLAYGDENTNLRYEEHEGYIHDWLNDEENGIFYKNLNNTKTIIQEGTYFCSESTNEETLTEGRNNCSNENKVTAKIGLISYDEFLLANGINSYLNIGQVFWTMTLYNSNSVWRATSNNITSLSIKYANGVRPVINVDSTVLITTGNGTNQNFYVLKENKEVSANGTLGDKATSGEYVNLEGKIYRIISKDSIGVKLILDDFYKNESGELIDLTYGSNNTFAKDSGIGKILNEDVFSWLGFSNSDKIVEREYYQSDGITTGTPYMNALKTSNKVSSKVGLIQVGEILASQSSTILTKNYTISSSDANTNTYWMMNKTLSETSAWRVRENGAADGSNVNDARSIRPVITVKNSLNIISGSGTWKNPYNV